MSNGGVEGVGAFGSTAGRLGTRARRTALATSAGEGGELERAAGAARELLAEDDEAGGDRDGVGRERGQAGAGERVAVLEGALQDARAERVADDQADDRGEPGAAVDDELGRDVAAGEEEPRREAERGAAGEAAAEQGERGAPRRTEQPSQSRTGAHSRRVVGLVGVDERECEQDEAGERDEHGDLLVAGEPRRVPVRGGEREHGDAGGADGLDERERGEAQRGDVDEPAGRLGCEAAQPAPVAEQERDEAERLSRREAAASRRRRRARASRPS